MSDAQSVILVAHGQPSAPEPAEETLAGLGRRVQAHLPDHQVQTATLATANRLEEICRDAGEGALIYPCFMARGYFTAQVLPKRLAGFQTRVLPPLGAEPTLPALVARFLHAETEARGWDMAETELLLAAHGSARGNKAAEAAFDFIALLSPLLPNAQIRAGFVEQDPRVQAQAEEASAPALCLPFFAGRAGHVDDDLPEALVEAGFSGPILDPIGIDVEVPRIIAEALTRG